MVDITAAEVFRDFVTDGVPSSGVHKPRKPDIRSLLKRYEAIIAAFMSSGGAIYASKAALDADLARPANTMAWVLGDAVAANNGIYRKVGASGAGNWVRASDLPYSFILASNAGAGTPSAIQATTSIPVSGSALILLQIAEDYAGTAATVRFNGGAALAMKTNSGADVKNLAGGSVVYGVVSGSTFRLANDEAIANLIYAARDEAIAAENGAQLAQQAAEVARDLAAGYVSDIVSEKEVPIYSTIEGMSGIVVPEDQSVLQVNGYRSATDLCGGKFAETLVEPDHMNSFTTLDGRFFEGVDIQHRLNNWSIAMFNGSPCKIDIFGDSTGGSIGPGGTQVSLPFHTSLRDILRSFYNNALIDAANECQPGSRLEQMLDGTDGSGQTFEERVAASTADIISIIHGINNAQNSPPTPPEKFKHDYKRAITIILAHGKIPLLHTPFPIWQVPDLGTASKAIRLKDYAQIIRDVAKEHGCPLVDSHRFLTKRVSHPDIRIQDQQEDGVHGTQLTYLENAQLAAASLICPGEEISAPETIIPAASHMTSGYSASQRATGTLALNSRTGTQLITSGDDEAKVIYAIVPISEPGQDIMIGYPIWIGGHANISVSVDQVDIGSSVSMYEPEPFGAGYAQDHEICVLEDASVGVHLVRLSATSGAGSIALNYVRTRKARNINRIEAAAPYILRYELLSPSISMTVTDSAAETVCLIDEWSADRYRRGLEIVFTAQIAKNEAFVLHGFRVASDIANGAKMGFGVGAQASSGYLIGSQAAGEGHIETVLALVDITGQEREWRVSIPAGLGQTASVFLDGSAYAPVPITKPYIGGLLGMFKKGAGTMTIKNLKRLVT